MASASEEIAGMFDDFVPNQQAGAPGKPRWSSPRRAAATTTLPPDGGQAATARARAEAYLKIHRQRLETYTRAIERRGFAEIAGQYVVEANSSCRGQKLDMRELFAIETQNGQPILAEELVVRQDGFETALILSGNGGPGSRDVVFPGVTAEDAVVFKEPANPGLNFWGVINERTMRLRQNIRDVQTALGAHIAPESDWQILEG
jgi:hypothetical protein